jgi:hypothetical protein
MKNYYTKQELLILESEDLINEMSWEGTMDWLAKRIENILMIAGFIPIIGEVADVALIIYYCFRKEWLYAGLMLIALIPTVGDFIAKPLIKLFKSPAAKGALKSTEEMVVFLKANPKIAEQYSKLGKYADNKTLKKLIGQVEGVSPTFARQMETSLLQHKSVAAKLLERPKGIISAIADTGKIGAGMTKFFREEKLAQYIAKKGYAPKTWLSNWVQVTYMGSRAKRQYIKNFILANNLLSFLGIPNLTDFERRLNDPNELEKLANNPKFSEMVNSNTSQSDLAKIESNMRGEEDNGEMFGGAMGVGMLKLLAQKYV